MSTSTTSEHFLNIKREIAGSYPNFQERATKAWGEIIHELAKLSTTVSEKGSEV